jgi:hypothetical protein
MSREPAKIETCLNCGRTVAGENFCPSCGQDTDARIVSAGHLLRDICDEFLKYDAKLLLTIRYLIFKPGFLTNEYLAGRRVRYITPFKLYFIVSAVFFFTYSMTGMDRRDRDLGTSTQAALHIDMAAPVAQHGVQPKTANSDVGGGAMANQLDRFTARTLALQDWILSHISVMMILFIPLTALTLKLLYHRSGRLYVEHLVFASHVSAFSLLFSVPGLLLHHMPTYYAASFLGGPLYTIVAMRRVYKQPVWKCVVKAVLVAVVPLVAMFILMAIAIVGLLIVVLAMHR